MGGRSVINDHKEGHGMRVTITTAAAMLMLIATAAPLSAQSPSPESVASGQPTGAPSASLAPTDCVPADAPSAEPDASGEPASSSAPAPDAAASLDPGCVAAIDPELVAAYTVVYDGYVADATPIVDEINRTRSWAQHRRVWRQFEKVKAGYIKSMVALPWPDDLQDDFGRWEALQRQSLALARKIARARDNATLRRLYRQDEALQGKIPPVTAELRARLGLE
jgi:hypothetical protein